ncbi:MAG: phosphoribosyltransferase family protein [Gammaproteobacteria bacterium]|nr:phosphoribosyltransferase family protein [Gammaproteobacteria bacterium]
MKKQYITADKLLEDSLELAFRIINSKFKPDLIVGIWRGGTPVGIAVQEVMEFVGINSDHIAIRTSSYSSIEQRNDVKVHGLDYLEQHFAADNKLLLVDDVFDTGQSIESVIRELGVLCKGSTPEIRIATPYYKPGNNQTGRVPDFFLFETDDWLVFPHELIGLSVKEILNEKPLPEGVKEKLLFLQRRLAVD